MTRKVLIVANVVKTHIIQFHLPLIKALHDAGWEVHVAAKNDFVPRSLCVIPYCDHYFDLPFSRNIFKKDNLTSYKLIKQIITLNKYDVIHCNTPIPSALCRLAARNSEAKIIYTAHGFHFFNGAPLLNWLFYYPVELLLSRYTDVLITINDEDFKRALTFHAKKVVKIAGIGVSVENFRQCDKKNYIDREKLGIPNDAFVLLSVGELIKRKNHKSILDALSIISNPKIHYIICGQGTLRDYLLKLVNKDHLENNVHFIGYCTDMPRVYTMGDCFVFPSLHEGLPCAMMEALMSGLPVIASDIRGCRDLLPYCTNGILYPVKEIQRLVELITTAYIEHRPRCVPSLENVKCFDQQAILKEILAIYNELMEQNEIRVCKSMDLR